jgi:glycosyltransferase involved in cell wall biosynthesis
MEEPVVVIVSACDFPNGLAGPYRIRMFGKAFASIGFQPLCVSQYAPGVATPGQNTQLEGECDGVRFVYPIGTLRPPTTCWRMLFYKTWGLFKCLRHVRWFARQHRVACILSYGNTYLEDFFYCRLARSVGAMFIVEICDSPLVILNGNAGLGRRLKEQVKYQLSLLRDRYVLPKADYLFVISHVLFRHYQSVLPRERILLTPVIADQDAFPRLPHVRGDKIRLVWIGNFRPFEGLEFLIDAIGELRRRRTDFVCDVFGMTPKHQAYGQALQARLDSLRLAPWMKLDMAIPHCEVPALLQTADMLLIPRQDSELNRSNLPTKLVDYLMSGRPVVASRVGEILEYAVDRVNILYPKDASVLAFVDAIEFLANEPERADEIGWAGRELAEQCFEYRRVGERIRSLLDRGHLRR